MSSIAVAEIVNEEIPVEVVKSVGRRAGNLAGAYEVYRDLKAACESKVQGRSDVIDLLLIALLADGHVLLEDHPGSGKTTLAKALGDCIARGNDPKSDFAAFRRIQFTPDLLPSDVTGTTTFDAESQGLTYQPGPVFANVVLADEINRTSPKVQASMLEAMAEKQVTVDNKTHSLEDLFFVIATQNPLDQCGTYPLPQAQLDRFLFKIKMTFLSRASELDVLAMKFPQGNASPRPSQGRLEVSLSPEQIVQARQVIREQVTCTVAIQECLVDISLALRHDKRVAQGVSTRCLVVAIPALQVHAMMQGRDHVTPEDIRALAMPIFTHRLELVPGIKDPTQVIEDCMLPILEKVTKRSLWNSLSK